MLLRKRYAWTDMGFLDKQCATWYTLPKIEIFHINVNNLRLAPCLAEQLRVPEQHMIQLYTFKIENLWTFLILYFKSLKSNIFLKQLVWYPIIKIWRNVYDARLHCLHVLAKNIIISVASRIKYGIN